MEKNIQIKTNDGHLIYGVLSGEARERLIIFVHGLTGHMNEHIFYNAAKYFVKEGFAAFRFDLYSWEKGARNLSECTVETHIEDLNEVIKYFQKDFKSIYLVGHSLGGPIVIMAEASATKALALWDPSYDLDLEDDLIFDNRIDKYIVKWGTETLLSSDMVKSWEGLGPKALEHFQKPTKIICAGAGVLYKSWEKKLDSIKAEHEFFIVDKAGHCFDEEGTEEILFEETLKWFKNIS